MGFAVNAHSAVWNTWYRNTIGNASFQNEKGGFNNSIILHVDNSKTGWDWLYPEQEWKADTSCSHEPSQFQKRVVGITDRANEVKDLAKDGFNLAVDEFSNAVQESQDYLHGILTKTKDLIASPFQQQRQFAAQSMSSGAATNTAPEGLRLKSVLTIPAQAERIRILAKRTDTATDGVLAVLFAGVPLQVLGTDYFSATEFRELTLPIRHLRNRTGELELVLKRESGEEISLRIGSIEIENQSDVIAASTSLVVAKPVKNFRTPSTRILCQGQWRGKVPLQSLTLRVNQGAAIPLTVQTNGTWQFEADGLLPGKNQLRFDARTIHGQTLSASREVWRIVPADFQLAVQGEGLVKGVKLGTSTLEVGQELRLSTTPKTGHIFERWSGAHSGSSRTLNLRVASGMSLTAHFIPSPFIGHEGTYMDHTEAATPLHSAMISAVITQAGSVTLTLVYQGRTYRATGQFDANGLLSLYFNRTGQPPLSLHLAMEFATGEITGTLKEGGEDIGTVGAIRSPWTTRAPTSLPPRYTLVFDQPAAPMPPAYGYGTLTLTPAGAITWSGKLPDGSPVTQGARLLSDDTWIMQVSTHRGKGWAGGTVKLSPSLQPEPVTGEIFWSKPATSGNFLPAAFSGTLDVFGGVFQDLSRGTAPLFPGLPLQLDQMQMEWGAGLFSSPASTLLTLNFRRQFIFPTAGNSAAINLQTGLITGKLRHPDGRTSLSYQGVAVPGHTSGYGQFTTATSTGAVLLKPSPGVIVRNDLFQDNFDNPDAAEAGNGWSNAMAIAGDGWVGSSAVVGKLKIIGQRLVNSATSGVAAIYRSFDHSSGVRVRATFTHVNGWGDLQKRYVHALGVRSNGTAGNGLAVVFYRADSGFNNSTVSLYDGSTQVGQQATSFQFETAIRATVEFRQDGSVQVQVANADGSAGEQTLTFASRAVSASGSNVIFVINGSQGSLKGSLDDVLIEKF